MFKSPLPFAMTVALGCGLGSGALAARPEPPPVAAPPTFTLSTSTRADRTSEDSQSRDDRGCCVIKPSSLKTSWTFYDSYTRGSCVDAARQANVNSDFYKDQSCNAVK